MFGRFLGVYDEYPQETLKTYLDTYDILRGLYPAADTIVFA